MLTVGMDFVIKNIEMHNVSYRLSLYDTACHSSELAKKTMYKDMQVALIFVDNADINILRKWVEHVDSNFGNDVTKAIVLSNEVDNHLYQQLQASLQIINNERDENLLKAFCVNTNNMESINKVLLNTLEDHLNQVADKSAVLS